MGKLLNCIVKSLKLHIRKQIDLILRVLETARAFKLPHNPQHKVFLIMANEVLFM